jgi:hypothetical protein
MEIKHSSRTYRIVVGFWDITNRVVGKVFPNDPSKNDRDYLREAHKWDSDEGTFRPLGTHVVDAIEIDNR